MLLSSVELDAPGDAQTPSPLKNKFYSPIPGIGTNPIEPWASSVAPTIIPIASIIDLLTQADCPLSYCRICLS
mgnify:CR=1 FL=1